MRYYFVIITILTSILTTHATSPRKWTAKKSGKTITAEFAGYKGTKVALLTASGKKAYIPKTSLCEADQRYLLFDAPQNTEEYLTGNWEGTYYGEWIAFKLKANSKTTISIPLLKSLHIS